MSEEFTAPDDAPGAPFPDPLDCAGGRMDLAVDVGLAHAPRDELGVLRAEIQNELPAPAMR